MQISTNRHPSTISIELTVSLSSFATGSGALAVAACSSGADWGCSISAESDKAVTATDVGASEANVASLAASVTDLTAGATSVSATTAPDTANACGAPANSAGVLRDAARPSSRGVAPTFSMSVEPTATS